MFKGITDGTYRVKVPMIWKCGWARLLFSSVWLFTDIPCHLLLSLEIRAFVFTSDVAKDAEVLKVICITDHLLLPRVFLWDSSCFVSENILTYLGVFSNHYISRPYCSVMDGTGTSGRRQSLEIQTSDRSYISLSCCFFMPRITVQEWRMEMMEIVLAISLPNPVQWINSSLWFSQLCSFCPQSVDKGCVQLSLDMRERVAVLLTLHSVFWD